LIDRRNSQKEAVVFVFGPTAMIGPGVAHEHVQQHEETSLIKHYSYV
jgi:hypothetical protein